MNRYYTDDELFDVLYQENSVFDISVAKEIIQEKPYCEIPRHYYNCPKCDGEMWWYGNSWRCFNCGYMLLALFIMKG